MKRASSRRIVSLLAAVAALFLPVTGYVTGSGTSEAAPETLPYEELTLEPPTSASPEADPKSQDIPEFAEDTRTETEGEARISEGEARNSNEGTPVPLADNPYVDENGYITSTFGYPIQSDPFAGEGKEVLSQTGSQVRHLEESKMGSRQEIIDAGKDDFYILSDASFFGKWNAETQRWEMPGEINYQDYPGLSAVEEAVKEGNYDAAKEAYLAYYRSTISKLEIEKTTSLSKHDQLRAQLLRKNYLYPTPNGTTMLDLLYLNEEYNTYTVDATSWVNSYKGSRNEVGFYIVATDKDGGLGEFKSRESGDGPILRVTVNGNVVDLPAISDLYLSAGTNQYRCFGTENFLYAAESTTADTEYLVDENTKRIYMMFDISSLKAGDTISQASLILKGRNAAGNGKEKEILVLHTEDTDQNENSSTWYKKPSTAFSYDQVSSWSWEGPGHQRNYTYGSRFMEDMPVLSFLLNVGRMYEFTGDESYAYTVFRVFMDFLNVMGQYPRYFADSNMGSRVYYLCKLMPKVINSKYMTPDIFTGYMKEIWIECNEMSKYATVQNNWASYEKRGHYIGTVMYKEFSDSDYWLEKIYEHLEAYLNNAIRSDGSGAEPMGYLWSDLVNVLQMPTVAHELGLYNIPSPFNDAVSEQIRKIGRYCMNISQPGFRDQEEGDSSSYVNSWRDKFRQVTNVVEDPILWWAATNGREGTPPDYTSTAYLGIGKKVIMRTGWSADSNYLYGSVDGGQMVHAHFDDNQLILHAYGKYLLTDQGYGSYSSTVTYTFRSPAYHNTIVVNDKTTQDYVINSYTTTTPEDQVNSHTDIPRWETNNLYDFATMETGNTIDTDSFKRNVLFVKPGFWLVSDYLVPTEPEKLNNYKQNWHYLPTSNVTVDPNDKISETHFENEANLQVVPVNPDKLSRAYLERGMYSQNQGSYMEAMYTVYEQEQKGNVSFDTILYPQEIGKEYDIETQPLTVSGLQQEDYSAYSFTVTDNLNRVSRYQFFILHNAKKRGQHTIGNYTTDASMLLVQTDDAGNAVSFIAQDAAYIKDTVANRNVFKSDKTFAEFSAAWSGAGCELGGSAITADMLKKSNVTLRNAGVQTVRLNNQSIPFEKTDSALYFGEKPEEESKDENSSSHNSALTGGGSNGGGSGGGSSVSHGNGGYSGGGSAGSSAPVEPVQPSNPGWQNPFDDVAAEDWFYDAVQYVYENHLFNGVTQTEFDPAGGMTRAMAVTVLQRLAGAENQPTEADNLFADVAPEDWYSQAVAWAVQNGVVTGVDETHFDPDAFITRQQFAALLYRYTGAEPVQAEAMDGFGDADAVAPWAKDAVAWALETGLMNGADGMLLPENNIARAEAAAMLQRFSST